MPLPDDQALYDAIGGADGVEEIVSELYRRTLADDYLRPFFAGRSMDTLVGHQRALIAAAVGGPAAYEGRPLDEAHAGLAIEPSHFESLGGHLEQAMATTGVAPTVVVRVMAVITRLWYAQQWPSPTTPPSEDE